MIDKVRIRQKREGSDLRKIVAGMAMDPVVCGRIYRSWSDGEPFEDPTLNRIASWCIKHYADYHVPPKSALRTYCDKWSATWTGDTAAVDNTYDLLTTISREYNSQEDAPPTEYLLDLVKNRINMTRARRAISKAEVALNQGKGEEALQHLAEARGWEKASGGVWTPHERANWEGVYEDDPSESILVPYKAGLLDFFGKSLCRAGFVSFAAPDKTGKSYWLLDAAFRAAGNRKKVAYFECGDLTEKEVQQRLGMRAARRPRLAGTVWLPQEFDYDGNVVREPQETQGITPEAAHGAYLGWMRKSTEERFRLSCHSNSSLNVVGIESLLQEWDKLDDWRPDVIVIDYADILDKPPGTKDSLEAIDDTWKHLRRLSQDWNALVLTATQTNKDAYKAGSTVLRRHHFSGRKTKLAHVTGMIGINVNDEERELGVCRLNWIVRRAEHYVETNVCRVAGNLGIACPAIRSVYETYKDNGGGNHGEVTTTDF